MLMVTVLGVVASLYSDSCRTSGIVVSFGGVAIVSIIDIGGVAVIIVMSKWLVGAGVCWWYCILVG